MNMTVEEFGRLVKQMEETKAAYLELVDSGIDYETARVLLCNRHGMTIGRASDTIELLQSATGRAFPGAPPIAPGVARSQIQ